MSFDGFSPGQMDGRLSSAEIKLGHAAEYPFLRTFYQQTPIRKVYGTQERIELGHRSG